MQVTEDAPALVRGLAPAAVRRTARPAAVPAPATAEALPDRLARLGAADALNLLVETVCGHVADVLGHGSAGAVDPQRPLGDLGVDSLAALELRNRLGADTGLRLSTTLTFDYPTSDALARHLSAELGVGSNAGPADLEAEVVRLEELLGSALESPALDEEQRARVAARLRSLSARWDGTGEWRDDGTGQTGGTGLETATADELFGILDDELGSFS